MNPIRRLLRYANECIGLKGPHARTGKRTEKKTAALTVNSLPSIRTAFKCCKGYFLSIQAEQRLVRDELKPTLRHRGYAYPSDGFCGFGVVEL
jgi:hypothetical protein